MSYTAGEHISYRVFEYLGALVLDHLGRNGRAGLHLNRHGFCRHPLEDMTVTHLLARAVVASIDEHTVNALHLPPHLDLDPMGGRKKPPQSGIPYRASK